MILPQLMDFAGSWSVTRKVVQTLAPHARFEGTATFTPDGADLRYVETGRVVIGTAPPMHAERRYLWRATGRDIAVFFDDGRPFHHFSPDAPHATHWCAPDDYHVTYDFGNWPQWQSIWRVKGPRKDYRMETRYSPTQ